MCIRDRLANPDYFINYAALIIFVSFAALAIPDVYKRQYWNCTYGSQQN